MKLVGILNITPDSFSDGSKYSSPENALAQAIKMKEEGADIIDVGAESTRPGAIAITPEEEIERLEPVLRILKKVKIPISVDTRNPDTAWMASKYPHVRYINDVSGLNSDEIIENIKDHYLGCIAMHSLTVPADPQVVISGDPVEVIKKWAEETLIRLQKNGIGKEYIILDPGIGFGKTPEQSIELIRRAGEVAEFIHSLGAEVLYGHSRKSFLSEITAKPAPDRDAETAEISRYLLSQKIDYIRVHNIAANKAALETRSAL